MFDEKKIRVLFDNLDKKISRATHMYETIKSNITRDQHNYLMDAKSQLIKRMS